MKKVDIFFNTSKTLAKELTILQSQLDKDNDMTLMSLKDDINKILPLLREFQTINSFTLLGQDYVNFCLLIVHGSDMADYLLDSRKIPKKYRWHARRWQEIVTHFKPFIEKSSYSS